MANQGFRRSFKTPRGYQGDPGGRVGMFNQVYLGIVKNNEDAFLMGRLQVWIPEVSNGPDDESSWFTIQYCSPFAGATSVKENVKQGQGLDDTQQSYGWWAVPPDLENEVVVMFINGDPNKGIYIGGMYQQFMNHMVPGVPTGEAYQSGQDGTQPPVAEYNRWDPDVPNSDNHVRARFEPLHESLQAQGLYTDASRGPSSAGARRAPVSKVYGFKSPLGHQMVFDDGDDPSIRFRTRSGAQVYINDAGYIYVISANGNSWMEISDEGIDAYSAKDISLRSQSNINLHADQNINLHSGSSLNGFAGGSLNWQSGGQTNILSGAETRLTSSGHMNINAGGSLSAQAGASLNFKSGGATNVQALGRLALGAAGNIEMVAPLVQQNMISLSPLADVEKASGTTSSSHVDRILDAGQGYPDTATDSITSRLPSHEPWAGHGNISSPPAVGGQGGSTEVVTEGSGEEVDTTAPVLVPDDGTKFAVPVNGTCGSPFGFRIHPIKKVRKMHTGVDFRQTPQGTPIYASKGGVVTFAGRKGGYGNCVIIEHGNGMSTFYAHQSQMLVRKGQKVKQMEMVGKVGSTGLSTGPHLHFEVRKGGQPINPAQVIPFVKGQRSRAGQTK